MKIVTKTITPFWKGWKNQSISYFLNLILIVLFVSPYTTKVNKGVIDVHNFIGRFNIALGRNRLETT